MVLYLKTYAHFMAVSGSVFLRIKNVLDKRRRDSQTPCMFLKIFSPENLAVCEKVWKKCGTTGQGTDDHIMRSMLFACRITKATDARFAFPQRKCLRHCASMLRYTYTACVVMFFNLL